MIKKPVCFEESSKHEAGLRLQFFDENDTKHVTYYKGTKHAKLTPGQFFILSGKPVKPGAEIVGEWLNGEEVVLLTNISLTEVSL